MAELLKRLFGFGETRRKEVTPIPTPETALHSLGIGKSFKPEGRAVVPEDCLVFQDLESYAQTIIYQIQKLFETDKTFNRPNDPGVIAEDAYHDFIYTGARIEMGLLPKGDIEQARKNADRKFRKITGFGIQEVVDFDNKVRRLHGLPLVPEE